MIGIGIDTGGTFTDAVVYDMEKQQILCSGKTLTTKAHLEDCIAAVLYLLDPEYVEQAEMLALSTTLATNACLEDKGSRARILMIGMNPECMPNLREVYGAYGFRDLDELVFMEGKPENLFEEPLEPDWELLEQKAPEWFGQCGAVGVLQAFPRANGGRFEKKAKEILREKLQIPVTTACEMSDEVDVLRRGAGTLLNTRLIPLTAEFFQAVKHVMRERNMHVPVALMRSDGSLMSESLAREYPVETLLSGPAASLVGGSVLAGEGDAVIVDMGGTTTDVAMVRGRMPLTASGGIKIGPWKTTINGVFVDTFLLGGDSAVRFAKGRLYLDGRRVIPLSFLAERFPQITEKLEKLGRGKRTHTRMLHEFYVLQRDGEDRSGYTEEEEKLCAALREGPLLLEELAEAVEGDIYTLKTERLEAEGVLMRSGLTPTDMMILKGDFPGHAGEAARAALRFVARNTGLQAEEIPDRVYELVEKKLYCNLVRILLGLEHPGQGRVLEQENMDAFIALCYEKARNPEKVSWMRVPFTVEFPIVGVGAPVHIFLPPVAELLGTRAVIRENAPVANALGAVASRIVTRMRVRVKVEYKGAEFQGYSVYRGTERLMFQDYQEAVACASRLARELVLDKARRQGASEDPEIQLKIHEIGGADSGLPMLFESIVEATASSPFHL